MFGPAHGDVGGRRPRHHIGAQSAAQGKAGRPIEGRKGLGPAAREQEPFPGPAVTQT